jgi:RNA polymerase sigma-70 factor (ECF subfamily)
LANEDAQIVLQILSGKTSEYRRVVERYQRPIFRLVCNLIGDRHDAEDITQDVFVAAFDRLRSFDARRASLLTWLFTIARNRSVNYLKRRRLPQASEDERSIESHRPTDDVARQEFWQLLNEALDTLPIEQRTAFVLAEIEQLSYAEIASIERTTLGTVKSRIHRAKQALRVVLEPTMREQ